MNAEVRKLFFIVNRYSGSGFNAAMEKTVTRACVAHGAEHQLVYTEGPGHATSLAADAVSSAFDAIIAVGGDGTVNEVAQALVNTPTPLGIIPKGSGNGLARHLKIPTRFEDSLTALFSSKAFTMDTFKMNSKLSLNVSGIGFDGFVADQFGGEKQRGFRGYARLVLNEFMHFEEFDATIDLGETQLQRKAFVIAIANSSQYGNNARISPAASVCDQLLNITVLKKFPPYRLDFIYSFFSGSIEQSAYCETLAVRNVKIRLQEPMLYHIDGEPAGKAEQFTIEMLPASLNILAAGGGRY